MKEVFPEKKYITLEDFDTRIFATNDPIGFLNHMTGDSFFKNFYFYTRQIDFYALLLTIGIENIPLIGVLILMY